MKLLTSFIVLVSFAGSAQVMQQNDSSLYIASYNIYTFGKNDKVQVYNAAKVLASGDFDLVALQEVMQDAGEKAVNNLVLCLKDSFRLNYRVLISPNIGAGYGGQERIAFLYKPDVLKPVTYKGTTVQLIDVPNKGRDFAFSHWSAGTFRFVLGSGHLYYGSGSKDTILKRRLQELELVYSFFKDPETQFGDEDLIFLGDFNRAALVSDYKKVSYDTSLYFIPNIEFFDPTLNKYPQVKKEQLTGKGVPNDDPKLVSTTVANGNTYVYDMIICSSSLLGNFKAPRNNATFNTDFGVISYDQPEGIGYIPDAGNQPSQKALKEAYSDHRPVWVRFWVK